MNNCTYVNRMVIYRLEDDGVIVNLMFKVSWWTRLRSRLGIDWLRIVRRWCTHLSDFVRLPYSQASMKFFFYYLKRTNMTVFKLMSPKPINYTENTIFIDILIVILLSISGYSIKKTHAQDTSDSITLVHLQIRKQSLSFFLQ